jgi:hypothetical protein
MRPRTPQVRQRHQGTEPDKDPDTAPRGVTQDASRGRYPGLQDWPCRAGARRLPAPETAQWLEIPERDPAWRALACLPLRGQHRNRGAPILTGAIRSPVSRLTPTAGRRSGHLELRCPRVRGLFDYTAFGVRPALLRFWGPLWSGLHGGEPWGAAAATIPGSAGTAARARGPEYARNSPNHAVPPRRVALATRQDGAFNLSYIGAFGAQTVMAQPYRFAHAIEQSRRCRPRRRTSGRGRLDKQYGLHAVQGLGRCTAFLYSTRVTAYPVFLQENLRWASWDLCDTSSKR